MKRAPLHHDVVFKDDEFTRKYAERHRKMARNFGQEYAEKLKSRGFQDGRILDAGCGFGGTALCLAEAFPKSEVVGVDLSEPLLRIASRETQEAGLTARVSFEDLDVQALPYDADSFDVVINVNMAHVVEKPVAMLNEIERVLAPDGSLFIADVRRSWLGLFERAVKSGLTADEARRLLERSNLREGEFSSSLLWWKFET